MPMRNPKYVGPVGAHDAQSAANTAKHADRSMGPSFPGRPAAREMQAR